MEKCNKHMEAKTRTTRSSGISPTEQLPYFGTANHPRSNEKPSEEIKQLQVDISKKQPTERIKRLLFTKEEMVEWAKRMHQYQTEISLFQKKMMVVYEGKEEEVDSIINSYNLLSMLSFELIQLLIESQQVKSREKITNGITDLESSLKDFPRLIGILEKQRDLLALSASQTEELKQNTKLMKEVEDFLYAQTLTFHKDSKAYVKTFYEHYWPENHSVYQLIKDFSESFALRITELYQVIAELEESQLDYDEAKIEAEESKLAQLEAEEERDKIRRECEKELERGNASMKAAIQAISRETETKLESQTQEFKAKLNELQIELKMEFASKVAWSEKAEELGEELQMQKIINEKINHESNRIMERLGVLENEALDYQKEIKKLQGQLSHQQSTCQLEIALLRTENELLKKENGGSCRFKRSKNMGIKTKTGRCMHPNSLRNLR